MRESSDGLVGGVGGGGGTRNLGKITAYRAAPRARVGAGYSHTRPLLTRRLNTELIGEHWDDLLCLAGSLKVGRARHP